MSRSNFLQNAKSYTAVETVRARRIGAVLSRADGTFIHFDDSQSVGEISMPVPPKMLAAYPPGVGDWLVEDEAGHQRIMPAGQFEDTYFDLEDDQPSELERAIEAFPEDYLYIGALPNRVTRSDIEGSIKDIVYTQPTGTLTICVLVLRNGFTVTGESACVDPANFDADYGRKLAYDNAIEKCWGLFGYLLAELRHCRAEIEAAQEPSDAPADQLAV